MEERLQELELRYTLQQDLLHELSDVVARHEREISALRREVEQLRSRRPGDESLLPFDPDEKPPHY